MNQTLQLFRTDMIRKIGLTSMFGILAYISMSFTRDQNGVAAIWLSNAVLVAMLLRRGKMDWPLILMAFLANWLANLWTGAAPLTGAGLALANSAEIIIVFFGMRRVTPERPDIMFYSHLLAFVIIGGLAAPFIGGAIAAVVLDTSITSMGDLWFSWFLTDSLGMLIVVPAIWIASDTWQARTATNIRPAIEWLGILGGSLLVMVVVFTQSRFPLLFMATPVIFFSAFRLGGLGATAASILVAIIASVATTLNLGPITLMGGTLTDQLYVLQCFLAVNFAMSLPVAAVVESRAKMTQALADSETLNRSMLDNMREVIFKADKSGRWIFLNPAWEDITGYSVQESLGWQTTRLLHPYDRETTPQVYADLVSGAVPECTMRRRFIRRNGETCHVDVSVKRLADRDGRFIGTTGNIRNVTELAEQQQVLQERGALLNLLEENVTDAVLRISLSGMCLYASPSAHSLFELTPEYMVGVNLITDFHPEDDTSVRETFRDLGNGKIDRALIAFRSASPLDPKRFRWMEANCAVVRDPENGAPIEIVATIRDVSATKQLEQELRDARTIAEQAVIAKSAFLANMSHEIRTPMNGVIGFTDLLLAGNLDADQREQVEMIAESGKSMMQLLNAILDTSKIEAGQMQIAEEVLDLRHNVRSVLRLMEPAARAKGIVIRSDVSELVPAMIVGDPLRLRQILINRVGNAIKFTEQGRVKLNIGVNSKPAGRSLCIDVTDSGIGISEDRVGTIFEKFTQADNSIARRFGGTGLGLSITRQLVELMDGQISVHSTKGEGSTFTVKLPLRVATGEKPGSSTPGDLPLLPFEQLQSRRILIAEDNDINQALMRAMMQKIGIHAKFASNGSEAVAAIIAEAEAGTPFDLVLMDMQMPVMDGLEATRRLRQAGFDAGTLPIVALTANAYSEDVAACREAGMQDHVSKPVTLVTVNKILTRFAPAVSSNVSKEDLRPAQPKTDEMPASLVAQYQHRKAEAFTEAERLAGQTVISDAETKQFIDQLHKLAGTAGFFGDESLGSAASHLEHEMERASCELRPRTALAGLAGLSNAQSRS